MKTLLSVVVVASLAGIATAQFSAIRQVPEGFGGDIDFREKRVGENFTRNIVITGYWPPTNNMVRSFSPKPSSNPGGWIGGDWEGRGWNIVSYFPEFPGQTGPSWGRGEGDFEVDYQDTSADWTRLVERYKPAAIITFSRAGADLDWELEGGNRMYSSSQWTADFVAPTRPEADLPIMQALPPGTQLNSSLPISDIIAGVERDVPALNAYATTVDTGRYLSNYIGLHGNWYHSMNNDPAAEYRNFAAGHIHVGFSMSALQAELATLSTLRTLTDSLNGMIPSPASAALVGLAGLAIGRRRR